LPRRFRAVATDIGSGKLMVLDHGDLARAVRASLSEPGFFPPVSWNGALLVDGVLRDYLPVDPARAMGAKVVIASDVVMPESTGFRTDAASIAERAINLLTGHARGSTSQPDARITPHIDPSPSPLIYPTDPSRLIHAGLEAALAAELPAPETAGAPVPPPAAPPRDPVGTPPARATAALPPDRAQAAAPAARDTLALPHHSVSAFGDSLATQARLDSLAAQASLEGLAVEARLDSLAAVARRDSLEAVAWRDSLARVRAAVVADSLAAGAIRGSPAPPYSAPPAVLGLPPRHNAPPPAAPVRL